MEPVYSRHDCIIAIRDYYDFLAMMFMDPSYIIEPPPTGWPDINLAVMEELNKTEEVVLLLRHLPYIASRPYSNQIDGLPGMPFNDYTRDARDLMADKGNAEGVLIMTQGVEYQFGGRVPKHCIGLTITPNDRDAILLDTRDGMVYWMACPDYILESSYPKPSWLQHPLPGGSIEIDAAETLEAPTTNREEERGSDNDEDEHGSENNEELQVFHGIETPITSDEEGNLIPNDEDDDSDGSDESESNESDFAECMEWGPSWHVDHFFEMLKNHFRKLNFVPKGRNCIIHVWMDESLVDAVILKEFMPALQKVYRDHCWPDLSTYRKEDCMTALEQVLKAFPTQHNYQLKTD